MSTRIATQIDEVLDVLEFAEREALSGSHVALMISYEAATAFDPVLTVHPATEFPLAWASVLTSEPEAKASSSFVPSVWSSEVSREEYDRSVTRIRDLIAAGDTYQVNYTFPLTSS